MEPDGIGVYRLVRSSWTPLGCQHAVVVDDVDVVPEPVVDVLAVEVLVAIEPIVVVDVLVVDDVLAVVEVLVVEVVLVGAVLDVPAVTVLVVAGQWVVAVVEPAAVDARRGVLAIGLVAGRAVVVVSGRRVVVIVADGSEPVPPG